MRIWRKNEQRSFRGFCEQQCMLALTAPRAKLVQICIWMPPDPSVTHLTCNSSIAAEHEPEQLERSTGNQIAAQAVETPTGTTGRLHSQTPANKRAPYLVSSRLAALPAAYHSPDLKPRCPSAFRKDCILAPTEERLPAY